MPTHFQGDPAAVLALDTFIKMTRAADSLTQRLAQQGTHGDLTATQFGTIEALYHLGPMCQNEIGGKLLTSPGNLSLVLENLEKLGLVHRQRDEEDRRRVIVSLTNQGRELIERIFPAHAAAITTEMSVLTPAEQYVLGQLCKRLGKGESAG